MSSRGDDQVPWTLEGIADPLEDWQAQPPPEDHRAAPLPAPQTTPDPRPAKGGTVLSAPQVLLLVPYVLLTVGFAYAGLTWDGDPDTPTEGVENRLLFAGCALVFALLTFHVLRHRVVLHGRFLHHRAFGWRRPVDLGRLASAGFEETATRSNGMTVRVRVLTFRDHDGRKLVVDRLHGDIESLYRELGRRFEAGDPVLDERLAAKVDRLREPPEA